MIIFKNHTSAKLQSTIFVSLYSVILYEYYIEHQIDRLLEFRNQLIGYLFLHLFINELDFSFRNTSNSINAIIQTAVMIDSLRI